MIRGQTSKGKSGTGFDFWIFQLYLLFSIYHVFTWPIQKVPLFNTSLKKTYNFDSQMAVVVDINI